MPTSKKPGKPKATGGPVASKRKPGKEPVLPDQRAMEGLLAMFSSGLGAAPGGDALDDAQELMYTAWETADRRQRVALAKDALRVSPLCADAYVLLAEEAAKTPAEAIQLYRKGVEAGEQAVGPAAFKDDVGHFWGLLETRPYMRARSGLAQALWAAGQHDEAIGHYRELLRLNPNDNQGNRYLLAGCLLALNRDAELTALLDSYGRECTAEWSYTGVLVAYRRNGDTAKTRSLLEEAVTTNGHVPPYLLGRKKPPRTPASYITMGGEDEAQEYARRYAAAWANTEGALAWLTAHLPSNAKKPRGR
jgi:tetratricopeptide (TPR) repeat protein